MLDTGTLTSFFWYSCNIHHLIRAIKSIAAVFLFLSCPQSRPFTNWKHLVRQKQNITEKNRKKTVEQLKSSIRQEFLFQRSNNCSPQFLHVYRLLWKEEGMLHSGKHGPVPTLLGRWDGLLPSNSVRGHVFPWIAKAHFQHSIFSVFHCEWNIIW